MFEDLNLEREIDITLLMYRNVESIYSIIDEAQPDFVFIWQLSYHCRHPYEYLETLIANIIGTATIIDVLRRLNRKCNLILITHPINVTKMWNG